MEDKCDQFLKMTPSEYVNAIISGNKDAEACFYETLLLDLAGKSIWKFGALVKVTTPKDLANDFFVYLKEKDWRVLRNYKGHAQLNSYMYTIFWRYLNRQNEQELRRILMEPLIRDILGGKLPDDNDGEEDDPIDNIRDYRIPSPDVVLERQEERRKKSEIIGIFYEKVLAIPSIAGLTDQQVKVIRLRFIAQWSAKETAELLSTSIGAINTTVYQAINKIRNYFRAEQRDLVSDMKNYDILYEEDSTIVWQDISSGLMGDKNAEFRVKNFIQLCCQLMFEKYPALLEITTKFKLADEIWAYLCQNRNYPDLLDLTTNHKLEDEIWKYLRRNNWTSLKSFEPRSKVPSFYVCAVIARFLTKAYGAKILYGQGVFHDLFPTVEIPELDKVMLEEVLVSDSKSLLTREEAEIIRLRHMLGSSVEETANVLKINASC
jgi:RNA polymerase sigma factor (sigma-70 family)